MSVADRRLRAKEVLRQNILDAAVAIMATEGFEALSIRRIAERIEYAPSTIYLHFRDKFEIVGTLCASTLGRLRQELEQVTSDHSDPLTALRLGLRCYVEFGIAHPQDYLVSFCQPMPELPPDHPTNAIEPGLRCLEVLLVSVHACIQTGRFRTMDVHLAGQSIWMGVHGLTSLLIAHGRDQHLPWVNHYLLIENTIAMLLRGLMARPEELPLPGQSAAAV
jgi:AcrR family transcriptional regulator